MRYLVLTAMVVGVAGMPTGGHAETGKKIHRSHKAYEARGAVLRYPSLSYPSAFAGNAAVGGNNANSMSGSNSAGDNAAGRTNGGGGMR